ncbi:MAG: hypothetical protein J4473_01575 [Candidatus Aenigmarchaeota archaeon]|nr:hypothetical protein [Candidatus Aenigmarchaeota archaeon]
MEETTPGNRKPMILLIDTNVLYSALVYKGLENRVLFSENYIFITTEFTIMEIFKLLRIKRGLSRNDALTLIKSLPILMVNYEFIKNKWNEANELIGYRDRSDIPLVALALSIKDHDGIWSSDSDFIVIRHKFKIWKTRELI